MKGARFLLGIGGLLAGNGAYAADPAQEAAVNQALPLTAEEIRRFRQQADNVSRAAVALPNSAPQIITASQALDISPGAPIPTVTLFPAMQAHVVFMDITGQPWPIERWNVSGTEGDRERFTVTQSGINILTVSSGMHYAYGHLGVKFEDLDTMVVVQLVQSSNAGTVDARRELHIQRPGPLAKPLAEIDTLPGFDPVLYHFLDNLPPPQAEEQTVRGDPTARAWRYRDKLIVRTQCALLSPAWESSTQAADGTLVYALEPTPALLISLDGKLTHVTISP